MTVYVITHKPFAYLDGLPKGYLPMMVGANHNQNTKHYLADNTLDNISDKNGEYCELTGLYWIWKNSKAANVGLAHYRRYFYSRSIGGRFTMYAYQLLMGKHVHPVSEERLDALLTKYDWIVAHPENEGGKDLWDQFGQANYIKDMEHTREAIQKLSPQYLAAFDETMHSGSGRMSPYNMFYTTKRNLDEYAEWLFSILFKVEQHTDMTGYTPYQQRLYGFLSERLLNVWLKGHPDYKVKYLTVFRTEELDRSKVLNKFKKFI